MRNAHSISTVTGEFDFFSPETYNYTIEEIAYALSNLCRFTGHSRTFYSVAEHSVYVSRLVPKEFALAALLHDASEAFTGDITKPLKELLPNFKKIETHIEEAIFSHFNVSYDHCIKLADQQVYWAERRDICKSPSVDDIWNQGIEAADIRIRGFTPRSAERFFMQRYLEIMEDLEDYEQSLSLRITAIR